MGVEPWDQGDLIVEKIYNFPEEKKGILNFKQLSVRLGQCRRLGYHLLEIKRKTSYQPAKQIIHFLKIKQNALPSMPRQKNNPSNTMNNQGDKVAQKEN